MSELKHPIKVVAQRTGLSAHVIRAWERRYGVVAPTRTDGNQRLYSSADIEHLSLLRRGTELGHSISHLADLTTLRLRQLLADEALRSELPANLLPTGNVPTVGSLTNPTAALSAGSLRPESAGAKELLQEALEATVRFDSYALERILDKAAVELGAIRVLNELIQPLVKVIGERWSSGELRVSHEHVTTAIIRTFLGRISRPISVHSNAPVLVCTTPSGQLHELGSLLVASVAANQGWRVVYGGPSLPAEEIASLAKQLGARAVALSIVFPDDDPALPGILMDLRRILPETTAILAGGRSARGYEEALQAIGAIVCDDLIEVAECLPLLRTSVGIIDRVGK